MTLAGSHPRRLLVFSAGIGDLVTLIPLLRYLAQHGQLDLLGQPWVQSLCAQQSWLGRIHTLRKLNRKWWKDLLTGGPRQRLGKVLAACGYDEIVLADREKLPMRQWIDTWHGPAALRVLPMNDISSGHMADRYLAAAARAGLVLERLERVDAVPRVEVPAARLEAARHRLAQLGQRVLAVQAGTSHTNCWYRKGPNLKGLKPDQWARLLARILSDDQAEAAVLHGSRPEGREAGAILAALEPALRKRVFNWTGKVPLEDLPAVLAASFATLSVDTGPGHVAAAVGCPLLTIFGPVDPTLYAPRGAGPVELVVGYAPCQFCTATPLYKRCRNNVCMQSLSHAALYGAWERLRSQLERSRPRVDKRQNPRPKHAPSDQVAAAETAHS